MTHPTNLDAFASAETIAEAKACADELRRQLPDLGALLDRSQAVIERHASETDGKISDEDTFVAARAASSIAPVQDMLDLISCWVPGGVSERHEAVLRDRYLS